jgi:hypothetical protein
MRSLWKNFTVLENTLFELQKVGNELASSPGHRRGCTTHALSPGETFVARVKTRCRIAKIEGFQKERN